MQPQSGSSPGAPVQVRRFPLAKNDLGIAQTVMTMQQLIDSGANSPEVREQAIGLVRRAGVSEKDSFGEVRAIFDWVKQNFRFTKDPSGKEMLSTAPYLLHLQAGDCDDYVVILGALLTALGHAVRVVTIAADPVEPGRMSHVYLETYANGQWIALDGTQANAVPGWQPPRYFRKKVWGKMWGAPPRDRVQGLGTYYVARVRRGRNYGLGIDWTPIIQTAIQTGAQIGTAFANKIQYGNLAPYIAAPPGATASAAYGSAYGATGTQPGVGLSLSPGVLLLGGALVLGAVLVFSRR